MWRRVSLLAALAAAACSTAVHAQMHLDEFFGQDLWNAMWGDPNEPETTKTTKTAATRVQMIVLDLSPAEDDAEAPLTQQERQRACQVGVEQLQTQWALQEELEQMRARLRHAGMRHGLEQLSVVQWGTSESCSDLERARMVAECERVVAMEETLRSMNKAKKSSKQMCAAVEETYVATEDPAPLSCKLCKRFVQMVVQAMKKDLDQVEQVREVLGDICDELSADSMCHTFLKRYDDIVEWLKEGTDPAYICPLIYMCPAGRHSFASKELVTDMDDKTCWFCDEVTTVLQVLVQEQPDKVDSIREYADLVCQMLGDTNPCQKYDKELDYVIDALKQRKTPREICKELKFCQANNQAIASQLEDTKEYDSKALQLPAAQSFHSCFYCVHVTSVVRFAVHVYPQLVEPIRKMITKACQWAPKDCKCNDYVQNYDKVLSMIKAGKEPREVCKAINMCKTQLSSSNTLLDIAMSDNVAEEVAAVVVPGASFAAAPDMKCFNCHYFTTLIEIIMQERPQILDEIREYADMICGLLGEKNQCHKYMKQVHYVVDALEKGAKPGAICVDLKYCTKSDASKKTTTSMSRFDRKEDELESSMSVAAIDNCFFCSTLGRFVKVALEQSPGEVDQIRRIADLICKMLPDNNKCHAIVQDMDKMIDSIRGGEDPAAVCHDLKYCTKTEAAEEKAALLPLPKPSVGNKCAYCDGLVMVLKYAILEKADTMDQLREAAGVVCDLMPEDDECHAQLKMYDRTVQELKQGKAPHAICEELKYCGAPTTSPSALDTAFAKALSKSKSTDSSMSVGCLFCEYVAEVLKHIHLDRKQLAQAKQVLESMCTVLPPSARCDVLSSQFDALATMMNDGKLPSQACHQIGLCAAEWVKDREAKEPFAKQKLSLDDFLRSE